MSRAKNLSNAASGPRLRARDVELALDALANAEKARELARFFKTGAGQYAEGDVFLGIQVPAQRVLAKRFSDLPLGEIPRLLTSPIHERRLVALLVLVRRFERETEEERAAILALYLSHTAHVNNWDLVDSSAHLIVGAFLLAAEADGGAPRRDETFLLLTRLARSPLLWERRIAMIATYAFIRAGRHEEAFFVAELLIDDREDLIHKAVGWMLREVGKRVGRTHLIGFLDRRATDLPRTALRYAIEHLPPAERKAWLTRQAPGGRGASARISRR